MFSCVFTWEPSARDLATIEAIWAPAVWRKTQAGPGREVWERMGKSSLRGGAKGSVHVIRGAPAFRFQQLGNSAQKPWHGKGEPERALLQGGNGRGTGEWTGRNKEGLMRGPV